MDISGRDFDDFIIDAVLAWILGNGRMVKKFRRFWRRGNARMEEN